MIFNVQDWSGGGEGGGAVLQYKVFEVLIDLNC